MCRWIPYALLTLLTSLAVVRASWGQPPEKIRAEILWDTFGIPHIFAEDEPSLFYAFGWAQMHSHGNLLLKVYGKARGRGAEYWGEANFQSDRWVRIHGIPERAREWEKAQAPKFHSNLEAFTSGINAYAAKHADRIADDVEVVLPVIVSDVLAHGQYVLHFTFLADPATQNELASHGRAKSFAVGWTETEPRTTPRGLADTRAALEILEAAARQIEQRFGALDVPWGEAARLHLGAVDLPANGGSGELGAFRVVGFPPTKEGPLRAVGGDSYVAAVEFSKPVRAMALLTYGSSSQPNSPHQTDQLPYFARKELRPVWLTRDEISRNLERKERLE